MKVLRAVATVAIVAVATFYGGPLAGALAGFAANAAFDAVGFGVDKPPPAQGQPTAWRADPNAPLAWVLGRTAQAGNIVYWEAHGADNRYQSVVTALGAGGPYEAIESLALDGVVTGFSGAGAATGFYADWMWQVTSLGATPATALAVPAAVGSAAPGWTGAHRLSGIAHSLWTMKWDTKGKKYQAGTPRPLWVIKGAKLYDPRADSTYPGGAGPQRASDPATWTWSQNPFLAALAWARGVLANGRRVLGAGLPAAAVDTPAFVAGANVADANGWKVGGVVYSTDGKWDVLKRILQAGGGRPLRLGAVLSCAVAAPLVSIATVAAADIVGEVSVAATQPRRDRINGAVARYRSEAHDWEVVSAAPIRVASYRADDGDDRTREFDYPLVQDAGQATRLAAYDLVDSRELGPVVLTVGPRFAGLRPGDAITATVAEIGLAAQLLRVEQVELDPASAVVTLICRSETTAKHAYALGLTGVAPPTPSVRAPIDYTAAPAAADWTLVAALASGGGQVTYPVLRLTGVVGNPNASGVRFEYRKVGDADWRDAGIYPSTATFLEISDLLPEASYEVAVSYVLGGAPGARLVPASVMTGRRVDVVQLIQNSAPAQAVNPLTATPTTIGVSDYLHRYPDVIVAITGGTITGLTPSTDYWVYFDDLARTGGTVALAATSDSDLVYLNSAVPGRTLVGFARTPPGGGGTVAGRPKRPPGYVEP